MGLKKSNLRHSYVGKGNDILKKFLLPAICESIYYDRITSFFTVDSLLAISQGIQLLYSRNGKMRLLIGIHSVPQELVVAATSIEKLREEINKIRLKIQREISYLTDSLEKDRIVTIAWMIEDGLLEVKAVATKGEGIFHPKTIILTDENGDKVVAVGSPNETTCGLGSNYESLMVSNSWDSPDAVFDYEQLFESLWNGKEDDLIVLDINEEILSIIKDGLGDYYAKRHPRKMDNILELSSQMPANFFVSGTIPALYVHQERAVIDALSRWPVRVLFADEVGLGKTFEVASTMAFMIKYYHIERVVILVPKAVIKQWQDELFNHFNIFAYRYDSGKNSYFDPTGHSFSLEKNNPLGIFSPNIILMSVQFARGRNGSNSLLEQKDTKLPDLLILDEAHSARVNFDSSGHSKKTNIYEMIEKVSKKIPHIIFATATPMQKDSNEYHAILKLLGLSKAWDKTNNYQNSLKLISYDNKPDTSDSYNAYKLLMSTINDMHPNLLTLDKREKTFLNSLIKNHNELDKNDIACNVQKDWPIFRSIFIKLHPAHLLTIRNTRRALESINYRFPKRSLYEIRIENADYVSKFYFKVSYYLTYHCFKFENLLLGEKRINKAFIEVSYKQRLFSSLFSCQKSLLRRLDKVEKIEDCFNEKLDNKSQFTYHIDDSDNDLDNDDELQNLNEKRYKLDSSKSDSLKLALDSEKTYLLKLIGDLNELLSKYDDPKIKESIKIALNQIAIGDGVLVFSRFTDTIEALINEYKKLRKERILYAIYTGKESLIIYPDDTARQCDKNDIKKALFDGDLKLIFCSDAASEGLNLQAARTLINVDVPWTPGRLEQRIGRIARLGQKATEVNIFNVWYPNSIEERMYHRIQSRLKESNLAIGEFPEVIAEEILNEVLKNEDSKKTLDVFNEIRNSFQIKALDVLWKNGSSKITESHFARRILMDICNKYLKKIKSLYDGEVIKYSLPDGTFIELSEREGMEESISLKSIPSGLISYDLSSIKAIKDPIGNVAAFVLKEDSSKIIDYSAILRAILGENITEKDYLDGYPKMLPNPSNLDLRYATDIDVGEPPCFWDF